MADVEVSYRGQIIRSMSASGTEVLHTKEKYCDDDITIDYTSPGGGGANLQTKSVSYTPTESAISDTVLPDPGYDGLDEVNVSVGAISDMYVGSAGPQRTAADLTEVSGTVMVPAGMYSLPCSKTVQSGTEGTPTASKSAVSNHSVDVTPAVTNAAGYISGGTHTGTPVTVTAAELVSGDKAITANGNNIDVTEYATVSVNVSGGGGTTEVASGTWTPSGSRYNEINIGSKAPLKNFMMIIYAKNDEEFAYNTNYKFYQHLFLIYDPIAEMVYGSTTGSYDQYNVQRKESYKVNNSGTITTVTGDSQFTSGVAVRNNSAQSYYNQLPGTNWRKYSDHISYYYNTGNGSVLSAPVTYNWKLYYFGTDPTNDFIEV